MRTVHVVTPKGRHAAYIRRRRDNSIEVQWYDDRIWFRPDREWYEGLDSQGFRTIADVLEAP